jgi:hypothetical protein
MDRRVMAFGGSMLLLLGAFLPAVSVPMLGSISYFDNGKGDGVFIIVLALASFVLAARNRDRLLLYTGSAAAALVLAGMIYLMVMIEFLKKALATDTNGLAGVFAGALTNTIQLQWGWALLLLGSLLVTSAGVSALEALSNTATIPTVDGVTPRKEYLRAGGVAGVVLLLALVAHSALRSPWSTLSPTAKPAISSTEASPRIPFTPTIPSRPVWEASADTNAIDGSTRTVLSLESAKPVIGSYGQEGKVTFILRCQANRLEAYVVTPGQLESDYSTHTVAVRVRFDDTPPESADWHEGTGGESILVPQPKTLLKRLLTTQKFLLEYSPFQQSPKTIEFDPAGLEGQLPKLSGCTLT